VWGDQELHGSGRVLRTVKVNSRKQSRPDSEMGREFESFCFLLHTKTEMVAEEENDEGEKYDDNDDEMKMKKKNKKTNTKRSTGEEEAKEEEEEVETIW
jgi:hypothetical protein